MELYQLSVLLLDCMNSKIIADGTMTTLCGSPGHYGQGLKPGSMDLQKYLCSRWNSVCWNHVICRPTPDGMVTTLSSLLRSVQLQNRQDNRDGKVTYLPL